MKIEQLGASLHLRNDDSIHLYKGKLNLIEYYRVTQIVQHATNRNNMIEYGPTVVGFIQ